MTEKPSYEELKAQVQELKTGRTQLEKKLHDARSFSEEIMTYMTEGLVQTDTRGTVIFINQRLSEMLGYLPEEITGECWLNMVSVEQQAIAKEAEARRAQGHTDRYEIILHHKNGHKFPVLIGAGARFDKQSGEFIGTLGVVTDITERRRAEMALKEKTQLLQNITDNMFDLVSLTDIKGNFTFLGASHKILNYDLENLIGKNVLEFIHPEDLPEISSAFNDFLSRLDNDQKIIYRYRCADGTYIWLETVGRFIRDDKGNPKEILFSSRDITERKRAENALLESEEKFRTLVEQAAEMLFLHDLNGNIIDVNLAAIKNTGYTREELQKMTVFDIDPDASNRDDMQNYWNVFKIEDPPVVFEVKHKRKNGSIYPAEVILSKIVLQDGHYLMALAHDISERKQAEETRRKYEKDLEKRNYFIQTILDNLPIGLAVNYIDQGKATYVNKKFEEIYGWPKQQLENIEEFFYKVYPDPGYRQKIMKRVIEDIESGDSERMVWEGFEITRQDGKKRFISAKNIALYEQNFMISTVQDITANKILQNQLNQAQKLESVGRLAGGVAHDFNNMLGVILGHTELALLQADENHDLYSDLKEIQKAAKRSADITKQLLAFARKEIISPRQLDLNNTVESMLNMLRRLIGEEIDLVWQASTHMWSVKMDPSQIDQILANLCINARDAISGVGKLTIETGIKTFDEEYCNEHPGFFPGDFVLLAVSDNGCGMDKDTLENLFEPFFTTKEVGKGTGLGLATVYGIIKQNNGFINVYSKPGQGSSFKIYLPRFFADEGTDKSVPEKKAAAGGTETILLVEDEPSILRMTRMMLEQKGYSVLSAATPAEAMEKAENHAGAIDMLMTDVVMPEMNGRDLAEQITALYPGIRLLFMSGYTANVIAHHGVLDDGVAFIQKPFSMADITVKVREVLDKASDETQG